MNLPACTPNSTKPPPPTASSTRCRPTLPAPRPRTPPGRSTSWPAASRARRCRPSCCASSPSSTPVLDEWLFDECYARRRRPGRDHRPHPAAADRRSDVGLAVWMEERIGPLRGADPGTHPRGAVRLLGRTRLARALPARQADRRRLPRRRLAPAGHARAGCASPAVDSKLIAQRLMGWTDGRVRPTAAGFLQLIAEQSDDEHKLRGGQPYPFFLAHQLQAEPAHAGRARPTGRSNGSTTASAPSWCGAAARTSCGRAAKT